MNSNVVKISRWLTIVAAIIFSIDALFSAYKTVTFQSGFDNQTDFAFVLFVCVVALSVTMLMGLGAYAMPLEQQSRWPAKTFLSISIFVGLVFLLTNFLTLSNWISVALASKSEYVVVCVVLCSLLLWLGRGKEAN
jgi:hypothetical protein